MGKLNRSWDLFRRSFQVVRDNRKLLLFPFVTFLATLVIALFFFVPVALTPTGHPVSTLEHWQALGSYWGHFDQADSRLHLNPVGYALVVAIYLISMFQATFFNVAFYHEILGALAGRPVSVRGGLRFALSRLPAILMWSLFAGVVGLIIKTLEEKFGIVGRWIMRLIGTVWSVACVFAIPAIVVEDRQTNPLHFLKSSASIIRKTWGESLIGYVGLSVGTGLAAGLWLLLTILGGAISFALGTPWPAAIAFLGGMIGIFIFSYILSVAGQVYRAALFVYATQGTPPGPFDKDLMDMAWKTKSH